MPLAISSHLTSLQADTSYMSVAIQKQQEFRNKAASQEAVLCGLHWQHQNVFMGLYIQIKVVQPKTNSNM